MYDLKYTLYIHAYMAYAYVPFWFIWESACLQGGGLQYEGSESYRKFLFYIFSNISKFLRIIFKKVFSSFLLSEHWALSSQFNLKGMLKMEYYIFFFL